LQAARDMTLEIRDRLATPRVDRRQRAQQIRAAGKEIRVSGEIGGDGLGIEPGHGRRACGLARI
jgi:hypothetical protein